jgi:rSAM/selenodomain-associated transferase 1
MTRRPAATSYARRLVVMVKEPRAGRVKTRLAREAGVAAATWFCRHAIAALIRRLDRPGRWQTLLAVTPATAVASRLLPPVLRMPVAAGDLGTQMQAIMRRPLKGPIVIVGADIPAIRASDIASAFKALGGHDAVLGPSTDGGYWLVGMKRTPRVLTAFGNVRWSGPHAMADTLANLAGHRVAFVATLTDVDSAAELRQASSAFGRRVQPLAR